jgi:uncharacterized protein
MNENETVSRYNIEVEHSGGMLLYNALTDKLLPISFKEYAIVETMLEHLTEFQKRYPDLYAAFRKSGFIIDSGFDELAYIKLQNKKRVYAHGNYHLTINPTLDCNLKCWYCSVGYAGTKHNREQMSDETVNALSRHVENLAVRQKAQSILLDWFGGEPMMYYDEVIRKVSELAQPIAMEHKANLSQHITTNATLLNEERIRQMKDFGFTFFQIPIDGNERRHNQVKYYPCKQGSYRDVVNNINLIADIIPNIYITLRINYDKQTLKNIRDILPDFSEKSKSHIRVDFQRIWQVPCTDKERELLHAAKEDFRAAGFQSDFWAYKPASFKRCYADSYLYYAINYNGKVFKCTARDYGDDKVIGNLQPSGQIKWNENILSKLFEKATFENEMCESCKMLPLCMGPCIQKNYEARINGTPLTCIYKNVEYSLSNYIIDMAKKRSLIQ